ncbi:MAG TPA: hypothetical protein P5323_01070 [Candidatus Moranbacteria bacterium]|nr:hypothetical protein [Candidatus Moranbacteria bacterium]HSA07973.1 hypothetical protein [Candidatus Moranbacteria bacterium]
MQKHFKKIFFSLIFLSGFLVWGNAKAACEGSYVSNGKTVTSYDATAGCIQEAVDAVISEDEWWTVVVPEATVTWGASDTVLITNKKVKIMGGDNDPTFVKKTVINHADASQPYNLFKFAIYTYPIEIANFTFNGAAASGHYPILVDKYSYGNNTKVNGLRIHHINNNMNNSIVSISGQIYGLIDNNTLAYQYSYPLIREWRQEDALTTLYNWAGTASWNEGVDFASFEADAVYVENNTYTNQTTGQICFITDSSMGGRVVARFNTATNCIMSWHAIAQSGGMSRGSFLNIFYNNALAYTYVIWHPWILKLVGGTGFTFNNVVTSISGSATGPPKITVQNYRDNPNDAHMTGENAWRTVCSGTNQYDDGGVDGPESDGYPCGDGIGLTGSPDSNGQEHSPYYIWNNTYNGSLVAAEQEAYTAAAHHTHADQDYYVQDDVYCPTRVDGSTNCTKGVGRGDQRPDLCTPGVAYFETDEYSLYKCTAANTWTKLFTPYDCPHPLAGLSGSCDYSEVGTAGYNISGSDTTSPASPTGLSVT